MKRLLLLALAIPMLFSSCMTSEVLSKAQGKRLPGGSDDEATPPPAPLYYVLLPAAVPIDIAFFPLFYFQDVENAKQACKD